MCNLFNRLLFVLMQSEECGRLYSPDCVFDERSVI